MEQFLAIVRIIGSVFPVLVECIKSIEEAIPQPGQGTAKLALVKSALEAAYSTMTNVQVTFEQLWPSLQIVISALVATFNATGVFKKK